MNASERLSTTIAALADATRRQILAQLAQGDATVGELAKPHRITLAAVSKHIRVLEHAGLVSQGRDAQRRPCHLEAKPLQAVAAWLEGYEQFWTRNLDSLGAYLGTMQAPTPPPAKQRTKKPARKGKQTK